MTKRIRVLNTSIYVQYGCGLCAPNEWINFDNSPTLRIQRTPIVGALFKYALNTSFPSNVKYGDIIKGLPIKPNTCNGVYCSHVLEHLSLQDFRIALANTFRILKEGGRFRCVLPDLEYLSREYLRQLEQGNNNANSDFMQSSYLGQKARKRGVKSMMEYIYGNSKHLWMWDQYSLTDELLRIGFKSVRPCEFNDSEDAKFKFVENKERFIKAVSLEAIK